MHQANATTMGRFMWHPISTAPFDGDLELAVIDANGVHALAFPCHRVLGGWIKSEIKNLLACIRHIGAIGQKTPKGGLKTDGCRASAMMRGLPYPLHRGQPRHVATRMDASGSGGFTRKSKSTTVPQLSQLMTNQ
jgi:hypothetical protein